MAGRRLIIVGNWKMYTDLVDGTSLVANVIQRTEKLTTDADIILCPPFTHLTVAATQLAASSISLGAQNMSSLREGAMTGEVSARMLLTSGCRYVIIGHSERRRGFCETNELINQKVKIAIADSLTPILCVGETFEEREAGHTELVVEEQVRKGLEGVELGLSEDIVLAYEPIWAIGSGQVAQPDSVDKIHGTIREILADMFGENLASNIRIQYGGSIKPENAGVIMAKPHIDGVLVGGASLDASSFEAIIRIGLGSQ
tara:strand:+ start:10189 stop:10962 length:774 start_codon:yes stop_codon:yes gene_type:complete